MEIKKNLFPQWQNTDQVERPRYLELSRFHGDGDADKEDAEHSKGCVPTPMLGPTVRPTRHAPYLRSKTASVSVSMLCSSHRILFWHWCQILRIEYYYSRERSYLRSRDGRWRRWDRLFEGCNKTRFSGVFLLITSLLQIIIIDLSTINLSHWIYRIMLQTDGSPSSQIFGSSDICKRRGSPMLVLDLLLVIFVGFNFDE